MLPPPVLYIKPHGKSSFLCTFKTQKKKEKKLETGEEKSKGGMKRKKKINNHTIPLSFFFFGF